MEITGVIGHPQAVRRVPDEQTAERAVTLQEQRAATARRTRSLPSSEAVDIDRVVRDLQLVTSALNKRLQFTVNRELGQVVVKVIDRTTDKVIKELPPDEVQRLHVRIREAIGLLIDEEI